MTTFKCSVTPVRELKNALDGGGGIGVAYTFTKGVNEIPSLVSEEL
jgi:hypothetical protein